MVMTSGTYTPFITHGTIETLLKLARADLAPERAEVALADDVVAHLAEGVLGRDPRLAGGHLDDAGDLGHDRPGGQPVEQLVDDLGGLPDLLEPDPVAGEAVAVRVGPDLPVDLVLRQRRAPSRRRSQSTPLAPQVGARQAVDRATSAGMTPMPRVRVSKISLPMRRSSISSQKSRGSWP